MLRFCFLSSLVEFHPAVAMRSCFMSRIAEFHPAIAKRRSWKCLSQSGARAAIFVFWSAWINKVGIGYCILAIWRNLSNSFKLLQKRNWKFLSQSEPWWPSLFSDRPKIHKFWRGHWVTASSQVSLNFVEGLHRPGEVKKCLSQSEAKAAMFVFGLAWKTQTWKRMYILAFCQSSWNSVQRFVSCQNSGKLMSPDGWRTVNTQSQKCTWEFSSVLC